MPCLHSPSHPSTHNKHHKPKPKNKQNTKTKTQNIKGGHYVAHALQPDGRWYRFNDAAVTHVPGGAQQVGRERAYLLVYQRVA